MICICIVDQDLRFQGLGLATLFRNAAFRIFAWSSHESSYNSTLYHQERQVGGSQRAGKQGSTFFALKCLFTCLFFSQHFLREKATSLLFPPQEGACKTRMVGSGSQGKLRWTGSSLPPEVLHTLLCGTGELTSQSPGPGQRSDAGVIRASSRQGRPPHPPPPPPVMRWRPNRSR